MIFKHVHPHRPTKCWCECPPSLQCMQLEPHAGAKCCKQSTNTKPNNQTEQCTQNKTSFCKSSRSQNDFLFHSYKLHQVTTLLLAGWNHVIPGCLANQSWRSLGATRLQNQRVVDCSYNVTNLQPCFGSRVLPHSWYINFSPLVEFRICLNSWINDLEWRPVSSGNYRQVTGSKWELISANCWKKSPRCVRFLENLWGLDPGRCGHTKWQMVC